MKALIKILTNRWLWAVIGLILLALLIWFGGPYLRFGAGRNAFAPFSSNIVKLSTIFAIVVLWGLNEFRKVLRANKANQGMVEGLVEAEADEPDRSAEEVATLKEKFEEAIDVLRKSKGKRKQLNLYDLPWYIIIGPPGSGKTTALVNSGLDFPLAETFGREALSGIGGTRNCDWWFTDEAILLDTAGRYTTQDSDSEVDKSAWQGFLGLLKKHRKRRPINGVLVAISLQDLMMQNEQERITHARAIKTRIQELDEFFKIRFPVYVMLTKTDLVAGFNEFFDDLGKRDREQVWGVTFPYEVSESGRAVEQFGSEFDALLERLSSRVLPRMSQERDLRRRAAIYGFPRQLASLKQSLQGLLNDVFRGSRYEQAPLLRGIYMTSGTQEGTPIDRLMGVVARTFGLDQQAYAAQGGQGRSYFIKSLLTDVVFNESEVAGTNRKFELQRAWLQRAAYIGCIALVGLMVVGWTFSYINNRGMVAAVQERADETRETIGEISGNPTNIASVVRALNSVESLSGEIDERSGGFGNISHGLGLSQEGKLRRRAADVYRELLEHALLPRLTRNIEALMGEQGRTDDEQYELLKHYVMLDSKDHYDAESLIYFFSRLSGRWLDRESDRDAFDRHVDALFSDRPTVGRDYLDDDLIRRMQRIVADIPIETRVYNRIKGDGGAATLEPFIVTERAGRDAERVFVRASGEPLDEPIPGLYTRAGFDGYLLPTLDATADVLLDEAWILGEYAPDEDVDEDQVIDDVMRDYTRDYIRHYDNLLTDIKLRSFSSTAAGAELFELLSDEDRSPLVLLLAAVAYETNLSGSGDDDEEEDDSGAARGNFAGLFGGGGGQQASVVDEVDEHFEDLRSFVNGEGRDAGALQDVVDSFYELAGILEEVDDQSSSGGDVSDALVAEGGEAIEDLEDSARGTPDVVNNIVDDAASGARNVAFDDVIAALNRRWGEFYRECVDAIEGRFPIDRDATQEINLEDFARFFGPGGTMDTFFNENLTRYVNTSTAQWTPIRSATQSRRLSAATIRQFQRADSIRNTFFRTGGATPSVSFDLSPNDMAIDIDVFSLTLEGKTIEYAHGPQNRERMTWPGPEPGTGVRMSMTPGGASLMREGEWAWFRLLDGLDVTPGSLPDTFTVDFAIDGLWAQYILDAGSAYNPFDFDELTEFSCPQGF